MAILAVDDVLEDREGLGILVAEHQHTGVVSGRRTVGGTALGPLTALVAAGKQRHGLQEVALDLVEDHILGDVLRVHRLDGRVLGVIGKERNFLIVSDQGVVSQRTEEQGLALDPVDVGAGHPVVRDLGEYEVATVHHVEVVTPGPLVADVDLAGGVEVVVREIPLLGGVPHLVAADGVQRVADTGEGTFQADAVVAGYKRLLEVGLGPAEVVGRLVVDILHFQGRLTGSHGSDYRKGSQNV